MKSTISLCAASIFCVAMAIAVPVSASSSGSDIIRPEPSAKKETADAPATEANYNQREPGEIIRTVNAGVKASAKDGVDTSAAAGKGRKNQKDARTARVSKKGKDRRSSYAGLIRAAAKKHGVPVKIAHAVVQIESNFNSRARGAAGEIGLMQIKPATARGMGYRGSASALYDPKTNLYWGMKYLAGAHKRASGDVCGTILRYNAGHYAKRMNPISRRYCHKVKRILASS